MKVGLTLSDDLISEDDARLAAQIGATDVVVHLISLSIAGVWDWLRRPTARAGAFITVFDIDAIDSSEPIPDGMVWNMRYRLGRASAPPLHVSDAELWDRLTFFSLGGAK